MTSLDEMKDRFTTKHIKHDLRADIEFDGWVEGEIDLAAIWDKYKGFALSALFEEFELCEHQPDNAPMNKKEIAAHLEILAFMISDRLDVWSDQGLCYLVDSINDLVQVITEQAGEIKELRNTMKRHNHEYAGTFTSPARWVP